MSGGLVRERVGPILRLTLSDNVTRNALSLDMLEEILTQLSTAESDGEVKVVVFSATGPAFSSGHNLKELTAHRSDVDKGEAYFDKVFDTCAQTMLAISTHRCAVIAEVDGLASAAGCQLVSSCDLAYASPRASFCTPGVNIGLFCSTPMVALSRATAPKHAMEMLLTGEVFDAEHAKRIGLINDVVPQNQLCSHVADVADKIAAKSGEVIAVGKKLFHQQRALPLQEAYLLASQRMVENMLMSDAIEGIGAFIEKRPAKWQLP
jgi:enoyl-CoA hydratase/carnithine racemase